MTIRPYQDQDFAGIDALWRDVFPNDPAHNAAAVSIPEKLAHQPDLLLVAEEDGEVLGTVMAGYDGHRGWLYSVAVRKSRQGTRLGRALVCAAEQKLIALGCKKINLQVRAGNEKVAGFYQHLGYEVEERVSLGKRITT